ncbi:hypothetical protein PGT21_008177 [Puccinia graminis f. sp. tritici]|uniref:Uncharacterized protein n=1 Tax=Puccinia graminis f. sp. tritici TaxID=56615 RepID=A0A5B0S6H3_PUCGR|nr:hypothetical protein PGT21_008177 [Puccinia graminis f. sp. tritici]KAA1133500.1 hypothetical protein PGTUg99_019178 [Puccinia graminis f. sp. tritici]
MNDSGLDECLPQSIDADFFSSSLIKCFLKSCGSYEHQISKQEEGRLTVKRDDGAVLVALRGFNGRLLFKSGFDSRVHHGLTPELPLPLPMASSVASFKGRGAQINCQKKWRQRGKEIEESSDRSSMGISSGEPSFVWYSCPRLPSSISPPLLWISAFIHSTQLL